MNDQIKHLQEIEPVCDKLKEIEKLSNYIADIIRRNQNIIGNKIKSIDNLIDPLHNELNVLYTELKKDSEDYIY